MREILLKDLKKGEYFTIKPIEEPTDSQVFKKGDYDRAEKKYDCAQCSDIWGAGRQFKGTKKVYIDFYY